MAQLGLSVASDDINVLDKRHPVGPLLSIGQVLERNAEHGCMQSQRETTLEVTEHVDVRILEHVILEELSSMLLQQHFHPAPQIFLLLHGCHVVEFERVLELRVKTKKVHRTLPDR